MNYYFEDIAKSIVDGQQRLLTIAHVANILNVSESTVRRLIYRGELMFCIIHRCYRVPESYLMEYLCDILNNDNYSFDCPLHS